MSCFAKRLYFLRGAGAGVGGSWAACARLGEGADDDAVYEAARPATGNDSRTRGGNMTRSVSKKRE